MRFIKRFLLPVVAFIVVAAVAFVAGSNMRSTTQTPDPSIDRLTAESPADTSPSSMSVRTSATAIPAGVLVSTSAIPTAPMPATALSSAGSGSGLEAYFRSLTAENSQTYVVQAGDNLTKISKLYGVTTGQIMAANGLQDENKLRLGMQLKIMKDRWSLVADKTTYTLLLKAGDRDVKQYRIGIGKDDSTPVGQFKIVNRLKNPTWYHNGMVAPYGSPDNPLGTRWMGFDAKTYGLHGTIDPESIGKSESMGCIRMLNSDVEELYELVPVGTVITILESAKVNPKR